MINMSIIKPQFNILSDQKSFFPLNFATNEQSCLCSSLYFFDLHCFTNFSCSPAFLWFFPLFVLMQSSGKSNLSCTQYRVLSCRSNIFQLIYKLVSSSNISKDYSQVFCRGSRNFKNCLETACDRVCIIVKLQARSLLKVKRATKQKWKIENGKF